jgi:hypothetical protein
MYRFGGVSVSLGAVLFGERLRNALFVMHVLDEHVSGLFNYLYINDRCATVLAVQARRCNGSMVNSGKGARSIWL